MSMAVQVEARRSGAYWSLAVLMVVFAIAFVLAFGKSYFAGRTFSGRSLTLLLHVHTATMVTWYVMLILQAWLVRTERIALHRRVGRASFVVAPLVVLSSLLFAHEGLNRDEGGVSAQIALFEVFTWGQIVAFAGAWGLGILFRKRTPLHARFMISTAFAAGTAISLRVLMNWGMWALPTIEHLVAANGVLLGLALLALIVNDWRLGIKCSPFWFVTIALAAMHIGFFTFARSAEWVSFVKWFAGV